MKLKLYFMIGGVMFLRFTAAYAQVTPNINSGNPAFPFPQFLDYASDKKTLASVNAPGVTHAEMEQRTREAWQLVCNNTSPYPNTVVGGVQYLYPTGPNHCTCAEGDGYYLLGAALMGDKTYFDGYYMWAHDRGFQGVKRFVDGVVTTPNYGYSKGLSGAGPFGAGTGVNGAGINGNSATDGDVDVAMALLIAYKQWGEKSGIVLTNNGWAGKEISYKEEALSYIRAMVDTSIYALAFPEIRYNSGVVGLDGYLKNGDSWGELTNWAVNTNYKGMKLQSDYFGMYYYDYSAPAWFRQFRMLLDAENDNPFYREQYKRVEASCDWLMGQHYASSSKAIPYMGKVSWTSGNVFKFENYIPDGEDFRASWRTIMNAVWHGNPSYTWDPVTHQPIDGVSNTYELDMGKRYAKFLKRNQDAPWSNTCRNNGDLASLITFSGPYTLVNGYTPEGAVNGGNFSLNFIQGTGAASAIVGQDFELMGEMFRQCVITWDAASGKNLDSRPNYFHEWFRLIGMLTLAGNFHAPSNMVAKPNLKVYHKVNKTVANLGEQVVYTVSYRNYGSIDGSNTVVKFGIPAGMQMLSSNKGVLSGDSVVWNVGTAKGFKTGALAATMDSMKITCMVKSDAAGRLCASARVSCSNGLGWVSNEYPNNKTAVMERNCVDVVKRGLKLKKTADVSVLDLKSSSDITYKLIFENASDTSIITGGRPGVRLSFAHQNLANPKGDPMNALKFRLFHDAAEAYIDYGNYRVSYFMSDPNISSIGTSGTTWAIQNNIAEGIDNGLVKVSHETIAAGTSAEGKYNQRLMLQFSPQLATVTQHLLEYYGNPSRVHEGALAPLRGLWNLYPNNFSNIDWTDDWSWDAAMSDIDGGVYYPIGDDFTTSTSGVPVNSWHKSACQTSSKIMKKILVEEWDGYTWRKVFGGAPKMVKPISNVVIRDTLPAGVAFKAFVNQKPLGVSATSTVLPSGRTVVTWSIPNYATLSKDSIVFVATVQGQCSTPSVELSNKAWISGDGVSSVGSLNTVSVKCVVTGNEDLGAFNEALQISPNPVKGMLLLSSASLNDEEVVVRILDVQGQTVFEKKSKINTYLDVSMLHEGIYFVALKMNGIQKIEKVFVEK